MPYNPLDAVDTDAIRDRLLGRVQRWPYGQIRSGGQEEWRQLGDMIALRDSIDLNQARYPIVCNLDGVILDGYRRYLALRDLDETRVHVIVVAELVEAAVALSIADDEQRLPHHFRERLMLADLMKSLPMNRLPIDGPDSHRDKGAILASVLGAERTVYYNLARLLGHSRDTGLPKEVRDLAETYLEETAALEGAGVGARCNKLRAALTEARVAAAAKVATLDASAGEGGEAPRGVQRTVNTAMQFAAYANALVTMPEENVARLPASARMEMISFLDYAMAGARKFRKLLQEK